MQIALSAQTAVRIAIVAELIWVYNFLGTPMRKKTGGRGRGRRDGLGGVRLLVINTRT